MNAKEKNSPFRKEILFKNPLEYIQSLLGGLKFHSLLDHN